MTRSPNTNISKNTAYVYRSRFIVPKDIIAVVIDGSVTVIHSGAFSRRSRLTSAYLPESVTCVEERAFQGCKGLISLHLPKSLTHIDSEAFRECESLTVIHNISHCESLTHIGNEAFVGCISLTSIHLSNSRITEIPYRGFQSCINLESIHLPETCKYIHDEAFYNCHSLTSVPLPDSVAHLGSRVFQYCNRLATIRLPSSLATIHADTFYECISLSLSTIAVPSSISTLDVFGLFPTQTVNGCHNRRNNPTTIGTTTTLSRVLKKAGLFPSPSLFPRTQIATTFRNARRRDSRSGRYLLCAVAEAPATKGRWGGEGGVSEIFEAHMAAVEERDCVSGFDPFMLAGVGPKSGLEVVYRLLRENPAAIGWLRD